MKEKLRELADAVLAWWKDHEYDAYSDGDGDERNAYDETPDFVKVAQAAILDAEGDGVAVGVPPEDRFEQFVAAAIARSREPLRELGEYLTRVLDEHQWPTADRLLLQLATHPARSGVVSDEDVEVACEAYEDVYEAEIHLGSPMYTDNKPQAMRAALESYERNRK